MIFSALVVWLSLAYRRAVLGDRRRLAQSRRPRRALCDEGDDPARLRPTVPAIAGAGDSSIPWRSGTPPMSLEVLATLMLVAFFVLLLAGIPVGLTLATTGFVFGYLGFGLDLFNLLPPRIFGVVTNYTLLAIPLFVFMGVMLEKSKLAEELMDVIGLAAGSLRGGLGIGIILVGVLDGRHHRHRRRHRGDARPAHAARHVAARLRPRARLRRDLRLRHARADHPAKPHPYFARRHHQPVGRHHVRRRHDPRPGAVGNLHRLHPAARRVPARMVPAIPAEERAAHLGRSARRQDPACGRPADWAGDRGARLDHRRHRRAVGGRRHGRARLDPGGGASAAGCRMRCCATPCSPRPASPPW